MKKTSLEPCNCRGNAMIYVLITIALLGILTVTLARQNDQSEGQDLSDEKIEIYTHELLAYAANAEQVIDMMMATGTDMSTLDFINPKSSNFDIPPHGHKIFHPAGGGLQYLNKFNQEAQDDPASLWVFSQDTNIQWTPTPINDVILFALFLKKPICEAINKKITGSKDIPQTLHQHIYYLSHNLNKAECPDCDGYASLCVGNNVNNFYSFYSIILAQ